MPFLVTRRKKFPPERFHPLHPIFSPNLTPQWSQNDKSVTSSSSPPPPILAPLPGNKLWSHSHRMVTSLRPGNSWLGRREALSSSSTHKSSIITREIQNITVQVNRIWYKCHLLSSSPGRIILLYLAVVPFSPQRPLRKPPCLCPGLLRWLKWVGTGHAWHLLLITYINKGVFLPHTYCDSEYIFYQVDLMLMVVEILE